MRSSRFRVVKKLQCVSVLLSLTVWTSGGVTRTHKKEKRGSSGSSEDGKMAAVRRERSLDHWNAETLTAYLGLDGTTDREEASYLGQDAAVMFYAQWCQNCHKLAPIWDQIAILLRAGTTHSNLIMALFNCELNEQHSKLCDRAGITRYPTLLYIGRNGSFPNHARTCTFLGNWGYADSVLDWIKTMQACSTWKKWKDRFSFPTGVLRLFSIRQKKTNVSLPIGIPPSYPVDDGIPYVVQRKLVALEKEQETLVQEKETLELATTHAGFLIDSFLFSSPSSSSREDIFVNLTTSNAWSAKLPNNSNNNNLEKTMTTTAVGNVELIWKVCVSDLTLDYCSRLSTRLTTEYLHLLQNDTSTYLTFAEMESNLTRQLQELEPYCFLFETCYEQDFNRDECKPTTCPFHNEAACRYVNSCFQERIIQEYRMALASSLLEPNSKTGKVKEEEEAKKKKKKNALYG